MTAPIAHKAIDLVAATAEMPDRHKRLAKIVLQARDAHSAHTDLVSAFDMIVALPTALAEAEQGADWASHTVPALVMSAILLYARATKSSSEYRSTLDLNSVFSDDEKTTHKWLCNLRDDALAHFGPGETFNGINWHEEKVLLPLDRPKDARILMASRRVAASPEVIARAKRHIHRAIILTQKVIEKRDTALAAAVEMAMESDAEFADFLKRYTVDMETVFEGHPIAETLINGPRLGPATEIVWAPVNQRK